MSRSHNILSNIVANVGISGDGPITPATVISQSLVSTDAVYSYLVYAEYEHNSLSGWRIEFIVSQNDRYNTIPKEEAVLAICKLLDESYNTEKQRYVIGYKQPPLDMLLELFDPLIQKLARQQHNYWGLEFEDLCQTCRLVICTLYKKGYYIHKSLINRSFINKVLMDIRKDRYKPQIVSIDEPVAYDKEGKAQMVADTIADPKAEDDIMEQYDDEAYNDMLQEKRDIIIDMIGVRQYDQLIRAYGSHTVSTADRTKVSKLKRRLAADGITDDLFRR